MAKEQAQKPITDEIAAAEKDIDIFAGWLKRLENPDPVLRTESGGKGLKLYDEVARDPHAGAVLQTRYLAVISCEREVLPGKDPQTAGRPAVKSRSEKITDFVAEVLKNMNFDQACQELLQAILYGFYAAEVMWTVTDEGILPQKILGKHPRRFSFTRNREPRLLTPQNMIEGEPLPDRKFIIFSYGSSDNPYGQGLGQKLWWPVWFKKNGIKFWLVFLEKFGMPTAVGKYPAGTPPDQQNRLLDAIKAIQTETGIKIPETMTVDLLEASRRGNVTYETLCDYMDRQISKAVLGQTLTTEVKGEGSYAASQTHEGVRRDIISADAKVLSECLNETLIKWIVDFNFPGVTSYPRLHIRTEAEQDLKALAERDKILVRDIGVKTPEAYFYDTYNLPRPEEGEALVNPPQSSSGPAPEFAQKNAPGPPDAANEGPGDTLDRLSDKTLSEADFGAFWAPVEKLLDSASSLEEFQDGLLDLYGDVDESSLGSLMQKAFALADLSGRYDAAER